MTIYSISYETHIKTPTIISVIPKNLLLVIFSFKKIAESIAIYIYPVLSNIGAKDNGIFFNAKTVKKVHVKNIEYATITFLFIYSSIFRLYLIPALFFNTICDMLDKKTETK